MAKKGFEVSGRMSVDKFENLFLQSFGVYCDILTEDNKIAKQTDTLAVLRPEDFKGPKKIDFSLTANMLVENVIKKFEANFGISLQIYEVSKASNKSTLAALRREVILEVNDDGIQAKKLEMEEKEFYIPLWHHEIHFSLQNKDLIIKCIFIRIYLLITMLCF